MNKRILLLILSLLALTISVLVIVYNIDRERVFTGIKQYESDTLILVQQAIRDDINRIIADLNYVSSQASSKSLLNKSTNKLSELRKAIETDFSHFLLNEGRYSQLRLIDPQGKELIRVDYVGNRTLITPPDSLQDKSDRYYFSEGIKLAKGNIYVSPFDLNIENGTIESPPNPTMRFIAPIYDDNDSSSLLGLVVLNYSGQHLLDTLKKFETGSPRQIWLINKDGYFMRGETAEDEWGFMFNDGGQHTLSHKIPKLWEDSRSSRSNQLRLNDILFSYQYICEMDDCLSSSNNKDVIYPIKGNDFPWIVVSRFDLAHAYDLQSMTSRWLWIYGLIAALFAITAISIFSIRHHILTIASLKQAKNEISGKKELLRTFINSNPALVYIKSDKGCYEMVNDAFAAFLGQPIEAIIGKTDVEINKSAEVEIGPRLFQEQLVLTTDALSKRNEQWTDHDNQIRNYLVTRFPIDNHSDNQKLIGVIAQDVTERDIALAEVTEQQATFSTLVNASPNAIMIVNNEGNIIFTNSQSSALLGWTETELVGMSVEQLLGEAQRELHANYRHRYMLDPQSRKMSQNRVVQAMCKDGSFINVEVTLCPIVIQGHNQTMCIVRDITKQLKMEEQLRQSQKLEAIGHLTGGIAHDFNNLLGVIIGNLDLLEATIGDNDKAKKRIATALKSALSGADLTKRLLSFARKQALNPEAIDITASLKNLQPILERSLKGDIELEIHADTTSSDVFIDANEFENLILNLAINARDAMPNGGKLTIETSEYTIDDSFIETTDNSIPVGHYIELIISDTGMGIPREILPHIFEPFYTTKEKGKGTGLGLSMVHGFVQQSKGFIKVYSEEGFGTSFQIYLPTVKSDKKTKQPVSDIQIEIPTGSERILVVDDEQDLAEVAAGYLESLGYDVAIANSGQAALDLLQKDRAFDLIISDIVMPGGMDGIALHQEVKKRFPNLPFIYTSGFSSKAMTSKKGQTLDAKLINKPFRKIVLAKSVREILDSNRTHHDDN